MRIKRAASAPTLALAALLLLATPPDASATPEFAKQWASSCASCHVGAPTSLGEEGIAFKLAGYDQAMAAPNPRPKLFLSLLTDLVTFTSTDGGDEVATPESAELFTLLRLDRAGKAKIFAIGEVADGEDGFELEFAHGHLQLNPLEQPERLNVRLGNVEPMTRLWNTDMRREFESPLWSGVDSATGALAGHGGGHHGGGSTGRPGVLVASDWGGDVSSVIGRNVLVTGGAIENTAFAGVFWKRGGRGFDNSTVASGFAYNALSLEQQAGFNQQQIKMAKQWERSVIFGLSAYAGSGGNEVFDGSFLAMEDMGHDPENPMENMDPGEEGEDHGGEGEAHGDEPGEEMVHDLGFLPTRIADTSRLVGEIKTRWDRYGFYLIGVYGENDYDMGDAEEWEHEGAFMNVGRRANDFFAWALEASTRFDVTRQRVGRFAIRYEQLLPENAGAARFERAVANLTIPITIMRPALWPYLETSHEFGDNDWQIRGGLKLAY